MIYFSPPFQGGVAAQQTGWWALASELILDHPQHAFHVVPDILIFEPHNPYAERYEVASSRVIALHGMLMIMCRAIELHSEVLARAVEVQHIWTNAVLAPELAAG